MKMTYIQLPSNKSQQSEKKTIMLRSSWLHSQIKYPKSSCVVMRKVIDSVFNLCRRRYNLVFGMHLIAEISVS
jgi:hypothetical protein